MRLEIVKYGKIILMLLILLTGTGILAQHARSNRIGFMLNNLPDTLPPVISILSPELNGQMKTQSSLVTFHLTGLVKDDRNIRFVAVNSQKKAISDTGEFTADVALYPGKNEIRLVAADEGNNLEEQFIVVEYLPPAANLELQE